MVATAFSHGDAYMFRSILVPVDLAQPHSWRLAMPQALELAAAASASLMVMTVVREMSSLFEGKSVTFQLEALLAEADHQLAALVAEYGTPAVPITQKVVAGSIGMQIVQLARREKIDLIVMASHRPGVRDYLIGPNAAHVARHAPCSVLVLRDPASQ